VPVRRLSALDPYVRVNPNAVDVYNGWRSLNRDSNKRLSIVYRAWGPTVQFCPEEIGVTPLNGKSSA